jgi:GNAT superfamily N-acetyltransferase
MELKIERAQTEDLENILELQKACYLTEARLYNEYNIPPLTQTMASICEEFEKGIVFLKAVSEAQLVGSVRAYLEGGTAYIGRLMVKQEFQNRKIGKALMNAIEQQMLDAVRFELFTGYKSEKNIALYTKLGYVEYRREYIHDHLSLVYMEKDKGK